MKVINYFTTLSICLALVLLLGINVSTLAQQSPYIIDVHLHGSWPESDDEKYREHLLTQMHNNKVKLAVISLTDYDHIANWKEAAPKQFLAGVMLACPRNLKEPLYKCFPTSEGWVDINWLSDMVKAEKIHAIHELGLNYYGILPSNPRFAPYFSLAAELDIPVGIHTQRGPPPGAKNSLRSDPACCPNYDPEVGNPALLRPVLEKHQNLRIWIQHVGSGKTGGFEPFWTETLALLKDYPNVYLDLSITNGPLPIAQYESSLKKLIQAGFGDRIMFGSDNLPYELILKRLDSMKWMSEAQRQAILFKNAETFFKLK